MAGMLHCSAGQARVFLSILSGALYQRLTLTFICNVTVVSWEHLVKVQSIIGRQECVALQTAADSQLCQSAEDPWVTADCILCCGSIAACPMSYLSIQYALHVLYLQSNLNHKHTHQ